MSYKRYSIETKNAELPRGVPRIFVERKDHCIGCGICARACVYGVHSRQAAPLDFTKMAAPAHELCVSCHRCTNECPVEALELRPHPEFQALGDAYYTPELIETLLYEADTGRVPVSGAGYRGPFTGPGFDAMWTDMSEIVRPTRDGIHGRETISTGVLLGRKPERLEFDIEGRLRSALAPQVGLPLPLFFSPTPFPAAAPSRGGTLAGIFAGAADEIDTIALLDEEADLAVGRRARRAVRFKTEPPGDPALFEGLLLAELHDRPGVMDAAKALKTCAPRAAVSILVPAGSAAPRRSVELARDGAGIVHIQATAHGGTQDSPARPLFECLRAVEEALLEAGLRDRLSVIASGGIARAEHAPKAILCGADAVGVDVAAVAALGMRRFNAEKGLWVPGDADLSDPARARQRLKNLFSSWRDQLLEVLGAMGLREVRRLEGEEGRALFFDALNAEFVSLFAPPAYKEYDPDYG